MAELNQKILSVAAAALVAVVGLSPAAGARNDAVPQLAFLTGRQLFAVDGDGKNFRELRATFPDGISDAAWSPDGRRVVYASSRAGYPGGDATYPTEQSELRVLDAATGRDRRVFVLDGCCQYTGPVQAAATWIDPPVWSPDGTRVAFTVWAAVNTFIWGAPPAFTSEIFIVRIDGSDLSPRVEGLYGSDPSWSRDGRRLAFTQAFSSIAVVDVEGASPPKRVSPPDVVASHARWAPDGRRIAFVGSRGSDIVSGTSRIWVAAADGSAARELPAPSAYPPSWSPDSRWITFSELVPSRTWGNGIWVIRRDGTGGRRLTAAPRDRVEEGAPQWSPDGNTIAFIRNDWDGGGSIWTLDPVDPARRRQIASFAENSVTLSWGANRR